MNDLAITEDKLLGGRVLLRQPADGYRVAIDPIFLAAAVPAAPGELVLDVGAGVGAAALCLAWREPNCLIRGIEIQHALVRLASENAVLNGSAARIAFGSPSTRIVPSLCSTNFVRTASRSTLTTSAQVIPACHTSSGCRQMC